MIGPRGTILLVEDSNDDVILVRRALSKAQVSNPIQVVGDGEAAIEYLQGRPPFNDRVQYPFPSLMLLDLKLPRSSGFEVLTWVRNQPRIKYLPVIALTASRNDDDITRAYDLCINSYLVKPLAPPALSSMLRTLSEYWLRLNEQPII
ncbi:MAG TPA: response regulator [Roseiflexaceae bacterium]|nr:response regulator [Roseiflexaceae bacterium]